MNINLKTDGTVLLKYEGAEAVVVIPEGITEIAKKAFFENKTLVEVTMPDSVKVIGEDAFKKCVKLKRIMFSAQLETIGDEAFCGCSALKEVALPDTLKSLGSGAFAGCSKLSKITCTSEVFELDSDPFHSLGCSPNTLLLDKNGFLVFNRILYRYDGTDREITVPDGVTHIANSVFESGEYSWERKRDIRKVILPDSMKYVGRFAFANCSDLEEFVAPKGVEYALHAFDGCEKLADEQGMVVIENTLYKYVGKSTELVIPEGVEILADSAFNANDYGANHIYSKITKVTLPESLKHIGNCTFRGCASLREINFPQGLETIDVGAFWDCINLKDITVPETAKIFNQAFNNCKGLADENGFVIINGFLFQYLGRDETVTVPESVRIIGNDAFLDTRVKSVTLPEKLEGLGAAFDHCKWLEEIRIPAGVKAILPYTFRGCTALKKVTLPDAVVAIGKYAFEDCSALEEIALPEGFLELGEYAFKGCTMLKAIRFPAGLKVVPHGICKNCPALKTAEIPEGVEVIGQGAFLRCGSLKKIRFPQSVRKIEAVAFAECKSLSVLEGDDPARDVDLTAFHNCPKLHDKNGMKIIAGVLVEYTGSGGKITVPDTVHTLAPNVFREGGEYVYRNFKQYREVGSFKEIVIPGSVKKVSENVLRGCKNLTQITLADGVEEIGTDAFAQCESLMSVTLPQTLRVLGKKAFAGCKALRSVVLPKRLEAIGSEAFLGCESLENIFVETGSPSYADVDGVLYNADKTELLLCPAGKGFAEFAVPDGTKAVGERAFADCRTIKKIVIPASVGTFGDRVFPRRDYQSSNKLQEIVVAVGAGEVSIGEEVFDFPCDDSPLVYPTLPVLFPKEKNTQLRLAIGYCTAPEKYSGEYEKEYRKYILSHKKSILKKVMLRDTAAVEAFFRAEEGEPVGYQPNLKIKKPSELQKVELLEEAVINGTPKDLQDVMQTYKSFEITARALGLAARYRGIEHVKVLLDNGASFIYNNTTALQRKYWMFQKTAAGEYATDYSLALVDSSFNTYLYSPMHGILRPEELEKAVLPAKARTEIIRYLVENKIVGISQDELLFWALVLDDLEVADALIEMGTNLNTTPPTYYETWGDALTYLDTVTSGAQSVFWSAYLDYMTRQKPERALPIFERFEKLAAAAGKKLVLTQKFFDALSWNDALLTFVFDRFDLSKINQKKTIEAAVMVNAIASLAKMAEEGWLKQSTKRDNLIEFARTNGKTESLAWLLDYKNRTADPVREAAKAEEKMMRELTADPNSVSALKKIWTYKKLEDGTLRINSYKGTETEITVPEKIGKAQVTVIGEYAFSTRYYGKAPVNIDTRKKITSVTLPEGVTEIECGAFYGCESLENISLPSTLLAIDIVAFRGCKSLTSVAIPSGVKKFGHGIFWDCDKLRQGDFVVIGDILFDYIGKERKAVIPTGVRHIAPCAFDTSGLMRVGLKEVVIPDTVEIIDRQAFMSNALRSVTIPASVKHIGDKAFYGCRHLATICLNEGLHSIGAEAFCETVIRNIIIPTTVTKLGAETFGNCHSLFDISVPRGVKTFGKCCFGWLSQKHFIHTEEGAPVSEFIKENHPAAVIFYDYGQEDYRKQ